MNLRRLYFLGLSFAAGILAGCDSDHLWESGPYTVYWINSSADVRLGIEVGGGLIKRVGPRIFAIGEDDRWIVAARHPEGDRRTEEFFYFAKAEDDPYKNADQVVKGPFTREKFDQLRQELSLPGWTKEFQ